MSFKICIILSINTFSHRCVVVLWTKSKHRVTAIGYMLFDPERNEISPVKNVWNRLLKVRHTNRCTYMCLCVVVAMFRLKYDYWWCSCSCSCCFCSLSLPAEKRTFQVFHLQVHFVWNFLFLIESVDVLALQFLEHIQNL